MIQSILPTPMDEREYFHYTIESITKDRTAYEDETSHVFLLIGVLRDHIYIKRAKGA